MPDPRITLRIGHSPDPDDAFMWYPLANFPDGSGPGGKTFTPRIDTGPYEFVHVVEDIQSLNERSEAGQESASGAATTPPDRMLEITALSIHQYPFVARHYALTSCGASMGDGYGPMVVARRGMELRELITPVTTPTPQKRNRPRLAIPGTRTSAWLALQLRLREEGGEPARDYQVDYAVVPFDQIIPRVASGEFDAGLIIHEGQLTYAQAGLECVIDLGQWWTQTRQLPLPLGGNAIRRDLGQHMRPICRILHQSIQYALAHRDEAIDYALHYARDMGSDKADQFVGMYVNQWTLDYGDVGRQAVERLLREAANANLIHDPGHIDFITPA